MIDAFYIFTKGGLLLWSTQFVKVSGNPLDRLIREVLLEERLGETFYQFEDSYKLKWKLLTELDLLFVVVYKVILPITYLESLLSMASKEFVSHVEKNLGGFGNGLKIKTVEFDTEFRTVREKADKELAQQRKQGHAMKKFEDTKKGQGVTKNKEEKGISASKKKAKGNKDGNGNADEDEEGSGDGGSEQSPTAVEAARQRLQAKAKEGSSKKKEDPPAPEKTPKKGKEMRQWDSATKVNKKIEESLDYSKKVQNDDEDFKAKQAEFLGREDEVDNFMKEDDVESLSSGDDEEPTAQPTENGKESKPGRASGLFKSLTRSVKNLTGGAVLTEDDLTPILGSFKNSLMAKNVAADVASKLAESVRTSLIGKRTDRFTSMTRTVKDSLQESMETLLTPKKSIDVLRAAMSAKNAGRVYSVVFLGVNGVGKSTNLAKVAYYLKSKGGLDVMLCACDTFRAGAVEQLKTHARCLDVPLFERGYGKDPAEIAKLALSHARSVGHEVVLIDTAGRMQDNEPLMKALAKLVAVNQPDLVLFVGEALVGNDAIDQVTKFNRSLIDMSHDPRHPRGIDGMLLTKYDTVDDKVGAALSMVYVTGQPIVFVGTGQKYTHLRKLQAKEVARAMLG